MKDGTRRLGTLVAIATVGALALGQGFKLARSPKLGQEIKYRVLAEFDAGGTPVTMSGLLTEKVVALDINGNYTVESRQTEVKARMGTQEQTVEDSPPETAVYSARGEVVEIKGANSAGLKGRLSRLNAVVVPDREIKVGDSWSHTFHGNPMTAGIGGKSDYKAEALEKVGERNALIVQIKFKESSGSLKSESTGKAWIDVETGELLKLQSQWKKVPFLSSEQPIDFKVTLTRA